MSLDDGSLRAGADGITGALTAERGSGAGVDRGGLARSSVGLTAAVFAGADGGVTGAAARGGSASITCAGGGGTMGWISATVRGGGGGAAGAMTGIGRSR